MPVLDPSFVRHSLKQLANRERPVFGADAHEFLLNPPQSERGVKSFEELHSIVLPPDYRDFLIRIGDGGAGPFYGVFPLGKMDSGFKLQAWDEGNGFIGNLSKPFPLTQAWNDLSARPTKELRYADEKKYERQLEEFDEIYWDPKLMNGAIPVCHMGCALRVWLIVTGDSAGHLWRDGRAEQSGLSPIFCQDGQPATFSRWYLEWLRDPESMK